MKKCRIEPCKDGKQASNCNTFSGFFLFSKFFKFSREVRAGAPPEVNLLTRLTAGQKLAVTPIPERLAALES